MNASDDPSTVEEIEVPTGRLRILETTDLHMQLLGYDYFADHPDENTGLIRLADTIDTLRNEAGIASMLFDNGDFLQGNPLADYAAAQADAPHPMIAAMNTLRYDAIALGNHEFNYGVSFLRTIIDVVDCPVLCANARPKAGKPIGQAFAMIDRMVLCDDGQSRALRVGVVGLVTPQIVEWDRAHLGDELTTDDIVEAARAYIPAMKAVGADVIVGLCHSGIGAAQHTHKMENAAVPLAAVPGIDVVLTGHTHEVFPGPDHPATDVVDPVSGTLHGKPAVMAGFYGNRVGVVDLTIGWHGDSWRVQGHNVRVWPAQPTEVTSILERTLTDHVQDAHEATLRHIRQPITKTNVPIHSFFTTVEPDLCQQLLAVAQSSAIAEALAGSPDAELPVLSATSSYLFGGRAGPGHYIDIPPGPLRLRDAAAIYPFANALCAVRRSGAELKDWLERAAAHYQQVVPGQPDQQLINPVSAAHNCDAIFGLSYEIDLTQPARYLPDGTIKDPTASRVCNVSYRGKPVSDQMMFVVATNSYRANGGGGFSGMPARDVVYVSSDTTRDVLIRHLKATPRIDGKVETNWHFRPIPDTSVTFQSAPAARAYLGRRMTHIGAGRDGFDLYRLML